MGTLAARTVGLRGIQTGSPTMSVAKGLQCNVGKKPVYYLYQSPYKYITHNSQNQTMDSVLSYVIRSRFGMIECRCLGSGSGIYYVTIMLYVQQM